VEEQVLPRRRILRGRYHGRRRRLLYDPVQDDGRDTGDEGIRRAHHRAAGLREDDGELVAEIVNLRRARKAKGRAEKDRAADANRAKFGTAKSERDLAKARTDKAA